MSEPEYGRQPEGSQLTAAAVEQADELFLGENRPRNVVGYGYGLKWRSGQPTDVPAVLAFVTQKVDDSLLAARDIVPQSLAEGTVTDVVAVGHLVAQPTMTLTPPPGDLVLGVSPAGEQPHAPAVPADGHLAAQLGAQALTRRMRPCPAGFSIGNVAITAGTLSGVVYDLLPGASVNPPAPGIGIPGRFYLLSNNHVLAASNAAPLGSPIVQPGPADGGTDPADRIGTLSRFIPLQFFPPVPLPLQNNVVDCAIAECQFQDATREIYFNGAPRGWRRRNNIRVGDLVRKTGRTTNTSIGRVIAIGATVDVSYGPAGIARLRDQIVTTAMSAGGDSGSLVTSLDGAAVGLLFAGSSQATIANYFENVRALLRVEIAELVL
jgi:hypothetical protein